MRWLVNFFRSLFGLRRGSSNRGQLFSMYFDESNSSGRRKPNRDRA